MGLKQKLQEIVSVSGGGIAVSNRIRADKEVFDELIEATPKLNDLKGCPIVTRVAWVLNDIQDFPLCKTCGKPVKKTCHTNGYEYPIYCNHNCSVHDPDFGKKITQGFIDTFGEDYKKRLGEITTAGMVNKYGVRSSILVPELREKRKQALIKHYGTDNISCIPEVKEKIKETMNSKYGVDHFTNPEKCRNTMVERYGVEHNSKLDFVQKKRVDSIRKTMTDLGYQWTSQLPESKLSNKTSFKTKFYNEVLINDPAYTPLFTAEDYVNSDRNDNLKFHCNICNQDFENKIYLDIMLTRQFLRGEESFKHRTRCPHCYPKLSGISMGEKEVLAFVQSIIPDTEVISGDRTQLKPKELDIYVPSKNFAIEFDGIYWHSDECGTDPNYHLDKTLGCEEKGIRLFHIFEDEWLYKRDLVESVIKSKLGIFNETIYARKCQIRLVSHKDTKEFCNLNHLQGSTNSSINIGLYYNNELVSIMTFGKSRYNKQYQYEMYRFCSKMNTRIIGGASRMFKYFIDNYKPQSIITYCDRRLSNGSIYENTLDMKKIGVSKPNYYYIADNDIIRQSRIKYQKHKLSTLLEHYDPNLSEYDNMINNGFTRIYDCGNFVFVYE